MQKKMLINASHPEESRVAVVCDGVLEELDVQVRTHEATLGNIYKGTVSRIEPSLQAVFVDYGTNKNGFLSINDVHPSYFPESFEGSKRRPRIQDVFKKDSHVLVQVNKEERAHKGASLTTNISVAGRYLVLMPGTDLYGVSRKIEDEDERKKLKEIGRQLKMPKNMGFIIRTAGMGKSKTELARDLNYLLRLWDAIEKNVAHMPAPALLYKEHDLVIRSIREHFSHDIAEILVDEKDVFKRVKDFFHQVMPKYESAVRLYQEKRPLFNKYQLEEQIECVYRRKIKLKSGGHIVIEPTEAMVSIDVNSGSSTKEKGIEETAFRVNMEAAPEIARQLRLRDLGGIIAIDFIDMSHKKHNQEIERALKSVLKSDRAKTKILRISALGVLELSRQRLKSSLGTGEYLDCPHCDGQGKIRSPETSALSIFRRVKSLVLKSDITEVKAVVPAKTAEYLLNNMRSQLVELEKIHNTKITVIMRPSLPDKDIMVEGLKEEVTEISQQEHTESTVIAEQIIQTVQTDAPETSLPVVEEAKPAEAKSKSKSRPRRKKKKESDIADNVSAAESSIAPKSEELPEKLVEPRLHVNPEIRRAEAPEVSQKENSSSPVEAMNAMSTRAETREAEMVSTTQPTASEDPVTKSEIQDVVEKSENEDVQFSGADNSATVEKLSDDAMTEDKVSDLEGTAGEKPEPKKPRGRRGRKKTVLEDYLPYS